MVEEGACAAFDGIASLADLARLQPLAAAGVVPRPIRGGRSSLGAWLEMDPDWPPPRDTRPRPLHHALQAPLSHAARTPAS